MREIFALEKRKLAEKEEAYLSTYCQGSSQGFQSVLLIILGSIQNAQNNQPAEIEDSDKVEYEVSSLYWSEEDADAFHYEMDESGYQYFRSGTKNEPAVIDLTAPSPPFRDYVVASPPTAAMRPVGEDE